MRRMLLLSLLILGTGLFLYRLRYKVAELQNTDPLPVYTNLLLTAL